MKKYVSCFVLFFSSFGFAQNINSHKSSSITVHEKDGRYSYSATSTSFNSETVRKVLDAHFGQPKGTSNHWKWKPDDSLDISFELGIVRIEFVKSSSTTFSLDEIKAIGEELSSLTESNHPRKPTPPKSPKAPRNR